MSILPSFDQLLVQGFALLLLWAAWSDIQSFTIPNRVSLAIVLLYPAHVIASPAQVEWLFACGLALLIFAVGAFAFARGWFGGGDVKLLTAATLWAGPLMFSELILVTALAGGALALVAVAQPRMTPILAQLRITWLPELPVTPAAPGKASLRTNIPYGVAIAAGGLWLATRLLAI